MLIGANCGSWIKYEDDSVDLQIVQAVDALPFLSQAGSFLLLNHDYLPNGERESGSPGSFGVKPMRIPSVPMQGGELPAAGKTTAALSSGKSDYLAPRLLIPVRGDAGRLQSCQLRLPFTAKKGRR